MEKSPLRVPVVSLDIPGSETLESELHSRNLSEFRRDYGPPFAWEMSKCPPKIINKVHKNLKGSFNSSLEPNGHHVRELVKSATGPGRFEPRELPKLAKDLKELVTVMSQNGNTPVVKNVNMLGTYLREGEFESHELKKILPIAIETARKGHDPGAFIECSRTGIVYNRFSKRYLKKNLEDLNKLLEGTRSNRDSEPIAHYSEPIAHRVSKGLWKGYVDSRTIGIITPHAIESVKDGRDSGPMFSAVENLPTGERERHLKSILDENQKLVKETVKAGFPADYIRGELLKGMGNGVIGGYEQKLFAPIVLAAAKKKMDVHDCVEYYGKFVAERKMKRYHLKHLAPLLMTEVKEGRPPVRLLYHVGEMVNEENFKGTNFQEKMKLYQQMSKKLDVPDKFEASKVFDHGLMAKGVSNKKVLEYQRILMRRGEFPTKGLIEKMHKVELSQNRKKSNLKRKRARKRL